MPFEEEELTAKMLECVIKVHQILSPGFLEHIYRNVLVIELMKNGLSVDCEKQVKVFYSDQEIGKHRLDLFIQNKIVVELKTADSVHPKYYAQLKSCLRAANRHIGLLVNFASAKAEFRRVEI